MVKTALIALIPLLFLTSWNFYVGKLGISGQFHLESIDLRVFVDVLEGNPEAGYRLAVLAAYIASIISTPLVGFVVPLSFLQVFALYFGLIIIANQKIKNAGPCDAAIQILVFTLGAVGYALALLLLYLFCFSEYEATTLASFDRYIGSYITAMLQFAVFLFVRNTLKHADAENPAKTICNYSFILLGLILLSSSNSLAWLQNKNVKIEELRNDAIYIEQSVEEDSKIYIISQGDNGQVCFYLSYYLLPHETNGASNWWFGDASQNEAAALYAVSHDANQLSDLLSDYDYLYLNHIDNEFKHRFTQLFDDQELITDNAVLRIVKEDSGMIHLENADVQQN